MALKRRTPMRRIVFFTILYVGVPFVICSFVVAKMTIQQNINKNSSVDVAKWDVAIEGQSEQTEDDKVAIVAGDGSEAVYDLVVKNDSDVATGYLIKLSNIPEGVKVRLDSGEPTEATDGEITFSQNGQELAPHDQMTHKMKFGAILATEAMVDRNISVDVIFTQKDPRQ